MEKVQQYINPPNYITPGETNTTAEGPSSYEAQNDTNSLEAYETPDVEAQVPFVPATESNNEQTVRASSNEPHYNSFTAKEQVTTSSFIVKAKAILNRFKLWHRSKHTKALELPPKDNDRRPDTKTMSFDVCSDTEFGRYIAQEKTNDPQVIVNDDRFKSKL